MHLYHVKQGGSLKGLLKIEQITVIVDQEVIATQRNPRRTPVDHRIELRVIFFFEQRGRRGQKKTAAPIENKRWGTV